MAVFHEADSAPPRARIGEPLVRTGSRGGGARSREPPGLDPDRAVPPRPVTDTAPTFAGPRSRKRATARCPRRRSSDTRPLARHHPRIAGRLDVELRAPGESVKIDLRPHDRPHACG